MPREWPKEIAKSQKKKTKNKKENKKTNSNPHGDNVGFLTHWATGGTPPRDFFFFNLYIIGNI